MAIATLTATSTPFADLELLAYPGQDPRLRMYYAGYEAFFNNMPVLDQADPFLDAKVRMTSDIMKQMAEKLREDIYITDLMRPEPAEFTRSILALEAPKWKRGNPEGTEVVVAKWGDGYTSPVHGHAAGYMHEEILTGKMRVNTYRITNADLRIVRPLATTIVTEGTFASLYNMPGRIPREALVHNFTAIGYAATLHYLPEHTRDGRDNGFQVERFTNVHPLLPEDVERITAMEGMYLRKGDVVLVRSENVPEYGDHFIVVTGEPIMKEHGLRVQDVAIHEETIYTAHLLDHFGMENGLCLLRLKPEAQKTFHKFHNITVDAGGVLFDGQILGQ